MVGTGCRPSNRALVRGESHGVAGGVEAAEGEALAVAMAGGTQQGEIAATVGLHQGEEVAAARLRHSREKLLPQ